MFRAAIFGDRPATLRSFYGGFEEAWQAAEHGHNPVIEGDVMPVLRKFAATAAVLAATAITAYPASAQALTSSSSHARLSTGSWTAYSDTDWEGPNATFTGNTGECHYVGDNWNDNVRSARANGADVKVELWDNADCTGGSITIDGSGYHAIGGWVSAYRVTS